MEKLTDKQKRRRNLNTRAQRFVAAIPLLFGLLLVWLIMNESFHWLFIVSGIAVAFLTLYGTRIIIHRSYVDELWLGWRAGIALFPYILKQIFLSTIGMAKATILGRTETVQFRFQSVLEDDLSIFLLCTFIILTPGTMVIGRKDSLLTIISIGTDTSAARASCEELERRIEHVSPPIVGSRARSGRIAAARRAAKRREEAREQALKDARERTFESKSHGVGEWIF